MRRTFVLLSLILVGILVVAGCTPLWTPPDRPPVWPRGLGVTEWIEDADNPVFGEGLGGPKAYYPCLIHDEDRFSGHGTSAPFKMWYGTSGGQTALAVSEDGIAWADLGVVLGAGYHTTVKYFPAGFAGSGPDVGTMHYRAWFWDPTELYTVNALGYGESADGESWTNIQPCQNGAVPIVLNVPGAWNRGTYGPCDVLVDPTAPNTGTDWTFSLYYDGTTGGDEAIGLGFSADGITWTGYDPDGDGDANPVLTGSYVAGTWDYNYVSRATILEIADGYAMWYSGGTGAMNHGVGYATSADGIHWTRDSANPLFHRDDGPAWRNSRTYCPAVLPLDSGYAMWFSGKDATLGDYSIGRAVLASPVIPVDIDIKPEGEPNSINLGAKGVLPVALLGSEGFDVSRVDPTTVRCASAPALRWHLDDVNGDGHPDLLFKFKIEDLSLTGESVEATLSGETLDGIEIEGTDSVRIVGGKKT